MVTEESIVSSVAQAHALSLVILFGSRAKGGAGMRSDTDIAVLANHPLSLKECGEIAHGLAREFSVSEDALDLIDIWNAPPLLQHEIALQGKLLYGELENFVRFRVLAWKRYLDTAKLRRIRAQSLKQYVQRTHP